MPDKETGAPSAEGETAATASPTPEAAVTDAPAEQETAEQKAARLEAELKNERALRLSHQQKVEEANRLQREREAQAAAPPTTAGVAPNPLDQTIAGLESDIAYWQEQKALAQSPSARREVEALERQAAVQRALLLNERTKMEGNAAYRQARPVFEADSKYGARADQLWREGRAATPQDAILLARGEAVADPVSAQRQQEADEAARRAMAGKPSTTAVGVTASDNARRKMTLAEFSARIAAGDHKLSAAADRGEIDVE